MNDEFENFMERVTEVEQLVKDMRCSEQRVSERARLKADLLLSRVEGKDLDCGHRGEDSACTGSGYQLRCRKDRTVINQKAFDRICRVEDPAEMSKEMFMAQVEKDAEMRARDKEHREQNAAALKKKANEAFRSKKFEVALDLYNKAIDERRDSAVLYENRALTFLNLRLYSRVVDDCDWALRLNKSSLKALLYKAKALHYLNEDERSEICIDDAKNKHPQHHKFITEFVEMWTDQPRSEDAEN